MKKTYRSAGALLAFFFVFFCAFAASAQDDCSGSVDKIATGYDNIAKKINDCQTLQEVTQIDFGGILAKAGAEFPESCKSYELTDSDKSRLKKSFKTFYDTLIDKMVALAGGFITREQLEAQMGQLVTAHDEVVDNASTLGQYADGMAMLAP